MTQTESDSTETIPANSTFEQIHETLANASSVLVVSHMRPDGDAIGSQLALGLHLLDQGKQVTLWNQDGVPDLLTPLPRNELVSRPSGKASFDVAVALDTATRERVGTPLDHIESAGTWINMDHHGSNPRYGDLNYIDSVSPATGQILYEYLQSVGAPAAGPIAENLYAAISTDTGFFQFPNTTARTFEIAAELVRAGVKVGEISEALNASFPRRRFELMRLALSRAKFSDDGAIASVDLPIASANALGAVQGDTEGLIDHLRAVQGVRVAALFEELEDGRVRLSLRSKDKSIDVAKICVSLGGGGHALAAGARLPAPLSEAQSRVLTILHHAVQTSA